MIHLLTQAHHISCRSREALLLKTPGRVDGAQANELLSQSSVSLPSPVLPEKLQSNTCNAPSDEQLIASNAAASQPLDVGVSGIPLLTQQTRDMLSLMKVDEESAASRKHKSLKIIAEDERPAAPGRALTSVGLAKRATWCEASQ